MVLLMNFHWSSPVGRPPSPFGPLGRSSGIDLRVENDLRVEADAALFLRPFRFKSIVTVLPLGKARS